MNKKDFPTPKNADFAYYVGVTAGYLIEKIAMVYGKTYSLFNRRSADAFFETGTLYLFREQPLWADVWENEPEIYKTTPNRRKSDPKALLRISPGTLVMVLEPLKRYNAGEATEYATLKVLVGEQMGYIALLAEHSFNPWHIFEKIEIDEK